MVSSARTTNHGYCKDDEMMLERNEQYLKKSKCNALHVCLQIGERFDALALTLEMPFKDNCNLPDARVGWSPRRSTLLGSAVLGAILDIAPRLRG